MGRYVLDDSMESITCFLKCKMIHDGICRSQKKTNYTDTQCLFKIIYGYNKLYSSRISIWENWFPYIAMSKDIIHNSWLFVCKLWNVVTIKND